MQPITIAVKSFEKAVAELRTLVSYKALTDEDNQGQKWVVALSFCRLLETGMSKTSFRKNSDAIHIQI